MTEIEKYKKLIEYCDNIMELSDEMADNIDDPDINLNTVIIENNLNAIVALFKEK